MEFRLADLSESSDVATLVDRLIKELGGEGLPLDEASKACHRLISEPDSGAVVVGTDGSGKISAICCMSYQLATRTLGRYAIVQEMYVSPAFRSRGVGGDLFSYAQDVAAEAGCSVVELGTPPAGELQERFYESQGFSAVGLRMRKVMGQ